MFFSNNASAPEKLLEHLEALTHVERIRHMVDLGRNAKNDSKTRTLFEKLERGDFCQRLLALQACHGDRNVERVLRFLNDPSSLLQSFSVKLTAEICDDAQALVALHTVPVHLRQNLLKRLARRRRFVPIDTFLSTLEGTQAQRLAAYGSHQWAKQHVNRLLRLSDQVVWSRLARYHYRLLAPALLQTAKAAEQFDRRLLWCANTVLPILADKLPQQAIGIAQALLTHAATKQLLLARLCKRQPNPVADMVLQRDDAAGLNWHSMAHLLSDLNLARLAEKRLLAEGDWFRRLKAPQRQAIYDISGLSWRDQNGRLRASTVGLLPEVARIAEARRHLSLAALATIPLQRLSYASFLPFDEARTYLMPFIQHPDAELRAAALRSMIGCGRFNADRLGELLALIRARANEQDPVRQAMMGALASLPPSRWQVATLPEIAAILQHTLDAADCSQATAVEAQNLVFGMLPFHPDWSATWFAKLGQGRGQYGMHSLEQRLTEEGAKRVAAALMPVLKEWEPRERDQAMLRTANMFGRHLRILPELLAMLERMTSDQRGWIASGALDLIATHARTRFHELVPALLKNDSSWITLPIVHGYLHRNRQNLLTPYLGHTTYAGRFSTGKTRILLPIYSGFERWTRKQQDLFAQVLHELTLDTQRDLPTLFRVIAQTAAMPAISHAHLIEMARVDYPKPAVRDTALRALGRLDSGEGVATLIAALQDERARIAIYALRSAIMRMPAQKALLLLQQADVKKVTVAKEIFRLLGELPNALGLPSLFTAAKATLHRDVRVALLRALWGHLEHEETWHLLMQAASDCDPAVAAGVIRIPADQCTPESLRRLTALMALLIVHSDPKVRLDILQRCHALPISDSHQTLTDPLIRSLMSPLLEECRAAALAIFSTYGGPEFKSIELAVRRLLPKRQSLLALVEVLQKQIRINPKHLQQAGESVLAVLREDPLLAALRLKLAGSVLSIDEVVLEIKQLQQIGLMHADVSVAGLCGDTRNSCSCERNGIVRTRESAGH